MGLTPHSRGRKYAYNTFQFPSEVQARRFAARANQLRVFDSISLRAQGSGEGQPDPSHYQDSLPGSLWTVTVKTADRETRMTMFKIAKMEGWLPSRKGGAAMGLLSPVLHPVDTAETMVGVAAVGGALVFALAPLAARQAVGALIKSGVQVTREGSGTVRAWLKPENRAQAAQVIQTLKASGARVARRLRP